MDTIHIFCVGGTIDKIYFDAKSKYEIGAPAIGKMLAELPVHLETKVTALMAKDSLEMTDADRAHIVQAVQDSPHKKIIITHGTDTMPLTARALADVSDKTVVLTGALAPAIFKDSDAMFNVGCALAAVQACQSGVYIAMNGQIFDADNVRKDVENDRFVALS
ncbi:MAG: L-asparaginase [Cryomorphaceae bacterium]|jgi:L-asparaginase